MFRFLIPLLVGFAFNWVSAFTHCYYRRWGERHGRAMTFVMRNILGIPVWAFGLILAAREPAPLLFKTGPVVVALAWTLLALGSVLMVWALALLGTRSFRPTDKDTLVVRGIYRQVRHPIYTGLLADFIAIPLTHPTVPVLTACGLGWIFVFVQARLEEEDLARRIPDYPRIMERVPRFVPRIGQQSR